MMGSICNLISCINKCAKTRICSLPQDPLRLVNSAALEKMVGFVEQKSGRLKALALPASQTNIRSVAVMHADTLSWALKLQGLVIERLYPEDVILINFTPVMTVHAGPGLLGLAYHIYENASNERV